MKPKVIHVAGTKGKGSTVEFIASTLRSAGYRVGVFTSPHIHTARERVKVGESLISKDVLCKYSVEAIERLQSKSWVMFFDLLVYVAIKHFAQENVEFIVLETGIGGRYDTTNFFDEPAAVAITSISLDHQAILGETVEKIAYQKAGIIKPNVHVFTPGSQRSSVIDVFQEECRSVGAHLHVVNISANELPAGINVSYETQVENACTAKALLDHLNIPVDGMRHFFWPCRMELFQLNDTKIIIDGCHNGDSVGRFLESLRQNYKEQEILVVFGAGMEKSLDDMLRALFNKSDKILMVQSKHFKALGEIDLVNMCPKSDLGDNLNKLLSDPSNILNFEPLMNRCPEGTVKYRLDWAINYASTR